MSDLLGPVAAGAGLGFGVVFLMAVANGISQLIFNTTINEAVSGRLGGGSE
jgi:hypothetical protein